MVYLPLMNKIILDTDLSMGSPGSEIDDGFALALAHADPEISLELVTTVNGNIDVESATVLSLELLRRLGVPDIGVVKGASTPITHPERRREPRAGIIGKYGVGMSPVPGYAPAVMAERVMAEPGEITVVAIGPLTNVALAILMEPGFAAAVKEIVVMGGIFLGQTGQLGMPGEFNTWIDPESAATVLRSGAAQRWVGLDVTRKVRLTREHAERMAAGTGSFAPFAGESTQAWIDHMHHDFPDDPLNADSCAMNDPLAVAAITRPDLVTWADARIEVITGDVPGAGIAITDLLHSVNPPTANARIGTAVDVDGFTEHFLGLIEGL